jgi:hypothetical protein
MSLPGCLATGIGSLPHTDATTALNEVYRWLDEAPFWPQLPRRSPLENMYAQFAAGLPGLDCRESRLVLDIENASPEELAGFFEQAFAAGDEGWQLGQECAAGYHAFLAQPGHRPPVLAKGQVTGPISMGLSLVDRAGKPVLYHQAAMEVVCTQLGALARGQEVALAAALRRAWPGHSATTLVFIDEPYMAAYGSAFFTFSRTDVINYLSWVMQGIHGLKAVHCCANTDWSILLATPVDVLSFDAYEYSDALLLFAGDVACFLQRGGYLAWGIVPARGEEARRETAESLVERMLGAVDRLRPHGCPRRLVLGQSLVTPACGLGGLPVADAGHILELTARVARKLRRYLREEERMA